MSILSIPDDAASLADHFGALEDPRVDRTKKHELLDIIVLSLSGIICGADGWIAVEQFALEREEWLRRLIPLKNGVPSHDTIGRVFSALCPKQFRECFISWVESANLLCAGEIVAVDGKTMRRSYDRSSDKSAIHMVSAWASKAGVSLGHVSTDAKSNEITAIPKLLDLLSIKGCIVTTDAMGCQRAIADKIIDKKADYVLALKGNQATMYREVVEYFDSVEQDTINSPKATANPPELLRYETVDGDHGRIETRQFFFSDNLQWFADREEWAGLKSFIVVQSTREINGECSSQKRYFISSLTRDRALEAFAAVREHWGVENGLHWTLDVAFREDDCRIRKCNAAENGATIRKYALNLLKQEKTAKVGIKNKRLKAAISPEYLEKVLGI